MLKTPSVSFVCGSLLLAACGGGGSDSGGGGQRGPAQPPPIAGISYQPLPPLPASTTETVTVEGGFVILDDVAGLFFFRDSFTGPTDVTISTVSNVDVDELLAAHGQMYEPIQKATYQIRFNIGALPVTEQVPYVIANFTIHSELASQVGNGEQIDVFVVLRSGGFEDDLVYTRLLDSVSESDGTITTVLLREHFSTATTTDGSFEAVAYLVITPGESRIAPELLPEPGTGVASGLANRVGSPELVAKNSVTGETVAEELAVEFDACPTAKNGQEEHICPFFPPLTCSDVLIPKNSQGELTGEFGDNNPNRSSPHGGVDYSVPRGTPVRATSSGTVAIAEFSKSAGWWVVIWHDLIDLDGPAPRHRSSYMHLREGSLKVEKGDFVNQGDVIGEVNNSGNSRGDHLHLEINPNNPNVKRKGNIDPHKCINDPQGFPDPFEGTWDIFETATSETTECNEVGSFLVTITRDGPSPNYRVSLPNATVSAEASYGLLTISTSTRFTEGEGETWEMGRGSFTMFGDFTGQSNWNYTEGNFRCSGNSRFTGSRLQ